MGKVLLPPFWELGKEAESNEVTLQSWHLLSADYEQALLSAP